MLIDGENGYYEPTGTTEPIITKNGIEYLNDEFFYN